VKKLTSDPKMAAAVQTRDAKRMLVALNPLVRDVFAEELSRIRHTRLRKARERVTRAMDRFFAEARPTIDSSRLVEQADRMSWKIDMVGKPTLYVFLGNWCSRQDLAALEEHGMTRHHGLMVMVTDQSLPSVTRVLANEDIKSAAVCLNSDLQYYEVVGHEHALAREIYEFLRGFEAD